MTMLNAGLGYALWQVQHQVQHRLERDLADLRLTLAQVSALGHLSENPTLSSAALARRLLLTPQAVSLLIARLEGAGYLTRGKPARGRAQPLELTRSGHHVVVEAERVVRRTHRDVFGVLEPGEVDALQTMLDHVLDDLRARDHEAPPRRRGPSTATPLGR